MGLQKSEKGKVIMTYSDRYSHYVTNETFDAILVTAPFGSVRLFGTLNLFLSSFVIFF